LRPKKCGMVCEAGAHWELARFLKLGRGRFKFCEEGADTNFQPAQDSDTHQWFQLQLFESIKMSRMSLYCQHLLICSISCYTAWFSDADYVVAWRKGFHNCYVPYEIPAPVPRVQSQTIGPPFILCQANRLQDRGDQCGSMTF